VLKIKISIIIKLIRNTNQNIYKRSSFVKIVDSRRADQFNWDLFLEKHHHRAKSKIHIETSLKSMAIYTYYINR